MTVLSALPVSANRPSGEKQTDRTPPECPTSLRTIRPLETSNRVAALSQLPVSAKRPSGEKLTERISFLAPVNRCTILPLATSHRIAVLSALPVSARRPSGEKQTDRTPSECPFSARTIRPLETSHRMAVLSQLPVSTNRPSGEKQADRTVLVCPPKQCTSVDILGLMPRLPSVVARRESWLTGIRRELSRGIWAFTVVILSGGDRRSSLVDHALAFRVEDEGHVTP